MRSLYDIDKNGAEFTTYEMISMLELCQFFVLKTFFYEMLIKQKRNTG